MRGPLGHNWDELDAAAQQAVTDFREAVFSFSPFMSDTREHDENSWRKRLELEVRMHRECCRSADEFLARLRARKFWTGFAIVVGLASLAIAGALA